MTSAPDYGQGIDSERALKCAVQRIRGDRVQIIEGIIEPVSPTWEHERAARVVRRQIEDRVDALGCVEGSGNLDLPGSSNWYVPDIAVVPEALAKGGGALLPDQTLLVVEVTSESDAETDRVVKRRRYAEYRAPSTSSSTGSKAASPCSRSPAISGTPTWTARTRSVRFCGCRTRSAWTWTRAGCPPRDAGAPHTPRYFGTRRSTKLATPSLASCVVMLIS